VDRQAAIKSIVGAIIAAPFAYVLKKAFEAWGILDPAGAALGGWLKVHVPPDAAAWTAATLIVGGLYLLLLVRVWRPRHIHHLPVNAEAKTEASLGTDVIRAPRDWLNQEAVEQPSTSEPNSQLKTLSNEFFQMRDQLAGVWVTRPMDSMPDVFRTIMSAMNRAGIEATSDLQNPSYPEQTGIVICVPDPDRPSETAKRLREVFHKVGIDPSFDVISDRQRLRPNDAPSLVIYVAPRPL
jgi:hypothetical protein